MRGEVFTFADDTKMFRHIRDSMDTDSRKLQKDLDTITEWADKWQMAFSVNKYKVKHKATSNPSNSYHMRRNETRR